jgi:hypothetical protein
MKLNEITHNKQWLWSFPSEKAALQWLAHRPSNTGDDDEDETIDEQYFQSLGGERPD